MARILLVDDDPAVRAGAGRFLRLKGHDVVEAEDGAQALRAAGEDPPELVITDINMPEMDGVEVILALSERMPGLPVIAMSGGGRMPKEVLLATAEVLGAVTTLEKPFDLGELSDAVARVMGNG